MRLVDADRIVYSWIIDNDGENHDGVTLQSIIDKMPTVDAEPVRHGRWEVVDGAEPRRYGCSVCKKLSWTEDNYCSYCGAKMDERGEDETN